jgi:branched-chain amino acid transport system ATP-binding protein
LNTLETVSLGIHFGGHVAVDCVSCRFESGTLTAIVGPNGAGKTTYFNLISGQLAATQGRVLLDGVDIGKRNASERTLLGIGRAFQLTNLFPRASVHENVRIVIQSRSRQNLNLWSVCKTDDALSLAADGILRDVGLASLRNLRANELSHGDQRKLEVALLMALAPKVYMFDEPTAGMSVDEVPIVLELIQVLKRAGDKIILLVEHKMDVIRSLADRVVVLTNGRLVADGDPREVMRSSIVQEAYLGKRRTYGQGVSA